MEKEIWKDIKGYGGDYQISNYGRVYSVKSHKYLSQTIVGKGYLRVHLWRDGIKKGELVHRLVAIHFLDNPNNLPQVNHKDENKENNCVDNLEWITAKENSNYGTVQERKAKACEKAIKCIELDKIFQSTKIAAQELELNAPNITACLKGRQKTCGGFHWEYA